MFGGGEVQIFSEVGMECMVFTVVVIVLVVIMVATIVLPVVFMVATIVFMAVTVVFTVIVFTCTWGNGGKGLFFTGRRSKQ